MAEELGKIEKPAVEGFKGTRKLFFVPLLISEKDLPLEIAVKIDHYWDEITAQLANLESKLGPVKRIYHELVAESGDEGMKTLKELNTGSLALVQAYLDKGAVLEAVEDNAILAELMDWSRCLSLNLQSQSVFTRIFQSYNEANKKRNETITKRLNDNLKENEIGLLIMAEGHQVQYPQDIQLIYVSPPSLDEIKRWLRDNEEKLRKEAAAGKSSPPESSPNPDL
jgi:hypothetical protein